MNSSKAIIDRLIDETSEDSVFGFLSALSAFGINTREDAVKIIQNDLECRAWAKMTIALLEQ